MRVFRSLGGRLAAGVALIVALNPTAGADTTRYVYDALGRLVEVHRANGSKVTYTFDAADNRAQVTATPSPYIVEWATPLIF